MHDILKIADGVTGELNNHSFSQSFTAQRLLLPEFDLSQLTELKVTVVPKSIEYSPFSRQYTRQECSVDIGIQKKIEGDLETQLPGLLDFVQEIVVFLRNRKLVSCPDASWLRSQNDPVYVPDHLANQRTFTSIFTVTYQRVCCYE